MLKMIKIGSMNQIPNRWEVGIAIAQVFWLLDANFNPGKKSTEDRLEDDCCL